MDKLYSSAICCVCGEQNTYPYQLFKSWKLDIQGDKIYIVCNSSCAEMYKTNPLVYEDNYDLTSHWIGTNNSLCRGWTMPWLREDNRIL